MTNLEVLIGKVEREFDKDVNGNVAVLKNYTYSGNDKNTDLALFETIGVLDYFLDDNGQLKQYNLQTMNEEQQVEYVKNMRKVQDVFNKYTFFENAIQNTQTSHATSNHSKCLDEVIPNAGGDAKFLENLNYLKEELEHGLAKYFIGPNVHLQNNKHSIGLENMFNNVMNILEKNYATETEWNIVKSQSIVNNERVNLKKLASRCEHYSDELRNNGSDSSKFWKQAGVEVLKNFNDSLEQNEKYSKYSVKEESKKRSLSQFFNVLSTTVGITPEDLKGL